MQRTSTSCCAGGRIRGRQADRAQEVGCRPSDARREQCEADVVHRDLLSCGTSDPDPVPVVVRAYDYLYDPTLKVSPRMSPIQVDGARMVFWPVWSRAVLGGQRNPGLLPWPTPPDHGDPDPGPRLLAEPETTPEPTRRSWRVSFRPAGFGGGRTAKADPGLKPPPIKNAYLGWDAIRSGLEERRRQT
jgi:hypothetical protein